ncbi:MAG: XdhC family protein [Thermoleophilia bacterium]|nr:XdhC family protein [Thermoleophilia bacterium]
MNMETVGAALAAFEQGVSFAWATILDSRGSAPRHAGTSMLVRSDGSIAGTVGGGPLEAAVIEAAVLALKAGATRMMQFDSAELGMMCGGGGLVLLEYVDPAQTEVADLYRGLHDLLKTGGAGWLVTVISGEHSKSPVANKCLVRSDGSIVGHPVLPVEMLQDLARKGGSSDRLMAAGGPAGTYVQLVGARGKAIVFGAGHCGQRLVPVLSMTGFFTTIVDDRGDFANEVRFPSADRIVVPESFDRVMETLPVDEDTYIVIMTRGHQYDRTILSQALGTRARYVGMMGSRKKVAETSQALAEQGFTPDEIARAHAPIGISIGAETPEEIAVSIVAELIKVRSGAGA